MLSNETMTKLIDKYSTELQIVVAMEELAELIKECSKFIRVSATQDTLYNPKNFISEIVDSKIMIEQLEYILKGAYSRYQTIYNQEYAIKLKRLKKRLEQ